MITIPSEQFPIHDKEGMKAFVSYCKDIAVEKGRWQVASISLKVPHIDPLAVIESIHRHEELHFFLESSYEDKAFAATEAIIEKEFSGEDRFHEMHAFSQEVLSDSIVTGDMTVPFSGIHFCCAFNFQAEKEDEDHGYPPARVFVPRWQVAHCKGQYSAVANILIDKEIDAEVVAAKVWDAYEKFGLFDYSEKRTERADDKLTEVRVEEVAGESWFEEAVSSAVKDIGNKEYEKVVLSRALDVECESLDPFALLYRIRNEFPTCNIFSLANGKGSYFVGASPERLFTVSDHMLSTSALAGSAPRGIDAGNDANYGRDLLGSEKNNHEHQIVLDFIINKLESLGLEVSPPKSPHLLQLPNVQHLCTPVHATLTNGLHPLQIASELHPTPAVAGSPQHLAFDKITDMEPFSRGPFAGSVGWFDANGNGEMVVAIRSALINSKSVRLYAGTGIVSGSDPVNESAETDLKFEAMLESLLKLRAI